MNSVFLSACSRSLFPFYHLTFSSVVGQRFFMFSIAIYPSIVTGVFSQYVQPISIFFSKMAVTFMRRLISLFRMWYLRLMQSIDLFMMLQVVYALSALLPQWFDLVFLICLQRETYSRTFSMRLLDYLRLSLTVCHYFCFFKVHLKPYSSWSPGKISHQMFLASIGSLLLWLCGRAFAMQNFTL